MPPATVHDLPTPALLVERRRLVENLDRAQRRADEQGVALRPHAKTHRSADLARMQRDRGAKGLTVATLDEAEHFAAAGFDDLLVAREVADPAQLARLSGLAAAGARVAFCVDTIAGANIASEVLANQGATLDAMIEVDVGQGRCGVPWDEPAAPALVAHIARLEGLRIRGLLTHAGHSYLGPGPGETVVASVSRAMEEERDRLLSLAGRLADAGLLDPETAVLSLGSTPTFSRFVNREVDGLRITEVRPGNYVFHDAQQVALGTVELESCALTCQASVFSLRRDDDGTERYFIDAGKKVLTSDGGWNLTGFGMLLYSAKTMVFNPHADIVALSEEHGWIDVPGGAVHEIGDRLRIVPNHACVAVATQRRLFLVDGEDVLEEWPVGPFVDKPGPAAARRELAGRPTPA